MAKKVFISYSHVDEQLKESLEDHLAIMRRNEIISDWNDRKITPGQDWANEISSNLEESDIILFLISSSFLASDYCIDIEAKRAIELHKEGKAKLIPIIVRSCDWKDFDFGKFQALPKDAKPIKKWDDEDDAWLDVISGLKKHINDFEISQKKSLIIKNDDIRPTDKQSTWIDDTEIVLVHRKADRVKLTDIYVLPDIEFDREVNNDDIEIESSSIFFKEKNHYLIFGDEQQGKTALLKFSFQELLKSGYLPIYLDAKNIKTAEIEKILDSKSKEQYNNLSIDSEIFSSQSILLIDNLDQINLNPRYRDIFINEIRERFDWLIITCHSSYNYIYAEIAGLREFECATLLGFGNYKREELVKKWISLGVEESIEERDLYSECDELKAQLNNVIKKNIVPPKPIYILMLVQMFEAYARQNLELTSYGHCYQQLIYTAFEKAGIKPKEYEKYLNVLTEISWCIFKNNNGLNAKQIDDFFREYEQKYLSIDGHDIIENLISHFILKEENYIVDFKYPYIYYFFVGKKFAEGFSESSEIKKDVRALLENLHREDYANILIFITHHTKDSWVLSEIKTVLSSLFETNEVATLQKDQLHFMDEFIKSIPELVLEQREIQKEREQYNKNLDDIQRKQNDDDFIEGPDLLANINKTFKGMEVAGQIIRNRHATLTRVNLLELAKSGASTGLRFLDYFIKISDSSKNEIIKFIEAQLAENPNLSNSELQDYAKSAYMHLTYGVVNGVVKKIASSIGSKEAEEIYASLEEKEHTPAFTLIKQSIEFQFKRIVNIQSVEETIEKLKNNPVCLRILKEMVIQHTYMFPVDYKVKQQLAERLNISVKGQRYMDLKKTGKG